VNARRGFTLVEAVVVVALGAIFLVVLWDIFSRLSSEDARGGSRLAGLQSTLLLVESLEKDAARMVVDRDHLDGLSRQLAVDTHVLDIEAFQLEKGEPALQKGKLAVAPLRYRFVPATHLVLRKEAGREVPLHGALYEDVTFSIGKEPPASRLLSYRIVTVPEAQLKLPPDRRSGTDRLVIAGSVLLSGAGERERFPEWSLTPLSRPVEAAAPAK